MEKELLNDKRREFLKTSGKLAGIGLCTCVFGSIIAACDNDGETVAVPEQPKPENYPVINIASISALSAVGGIMMMVVKDKENKPVNSGNPLIIYRIEQNKFIVLSSLCRHAGFVVSLPSSPGGDLICPAHSAAFDSDNGSTTSNGTVSGAVPPLLKYNSLFDAEKNELTIAI